jgi:predicted ATP-grasp superfamily ATP-dependent carboligase
MQMLKDTLKSTPIVYITRDLERALGLPLATPGYYIISNFNDFASPLAKKYPNILLIKSEKQLNTRELMEHPEAKAFIKTLNKAKILVFKNTTLIEKVCKKNRWPLLNPKAETAGIVEEKISQIKWLGELVKYLPRHQIKLCRDIVWRKKPFILQFNFAHTGTGTLFIDSKEELDELKEKFAKRPARLTQFIYGPIFTTNAVVAPEKIMVGNISYQITGLLPFTDNPFATIGNDWKLPNLLLTEKQKEYFNQMATDIGNKLRRDGWRGLFGIDVILEQKTGKLYLIEINARQPASATYESQLQQHVTRTTYHVTTFEAHLSALLDTDLKDYSLAKIKTGAQIVQRITPFRHKMEKKKISAIKKLGFRTIYTEQNTKPGADLLRMQTDRSVMREHNVLNGLGKKLL